MSKRRNIKDINKYSKKCTECGCQTLFQRVFDEQGKVTDEYRECPLCINKV